jgi:acetyl esterase/lipase
MKPITIHSLPAILPMMLFSGILLSTEPASTTDAPPPATPGAPGRSGSRFAKGPPPARKIVYKKVGGWDLALHVFEPAGQDESAKRPAIVFFHGGAWAICDPNQFYYQCEIKELP